MVLHIPLEQMMSLPGAQCGVGAYNCPCAGGSFYRPPSYVGDDYHCESGSHSSAASKWYMDNPLWDLANLT